MWAKDCRYIMNGRMTKELVCNALQDAINHSANTQGCILHSDRGSQYCSFAYQELAKKHGFLSSMSREGYCWDNAPIESFWGKLEQEWLNEQHLKHVRKQRRQYSNISGYFITASLSMLPMVISHQKLAISNIWTELEEHPFVCHVYVNGESSKLHLLPNLSIMQTINKPYL